MYGLVLNSPVHACCGLPRAQCKCSEIPGVNVDDDLPGVDLPDGPEGDMEVPTVNYEGAASARLLKMLHRYDDESPPHNGDLTPPSIDWATGRIVYR